MLLEKLKTQVRGTIWPKSVIPQSGYIPSELPYPTAELFVWRPANGNINFGDFLSRIIVELVLARKGYTLGDETAERRQMLAIGSVMHFARDGAVIWGSGVNGKIPADSHKFQKLDVRAVRGPLTRAFLTARGIAVPEVYGDPALLLPILAPDRFKPAQVNGVAFVPNLNDLQELNVSKAHKNLTIVSPLAGWNQCVSAILGHGLVLASSLHGLIVAEAYGIPARYVRLTETENLFKYRDYYEGTGRPDFTFANSVEEGIEMGGERPPVFDPAPLIEAFPFDLWDKPKA
jgi:pyruvyltransferase